MSLQQKIIGTIKKLTHGNPTMKAKFDELEGRSSAT